MKIESYETILGCLESPRPVQGRIDEGIASMSGEEFRESLLQWPTDPISARPLRRMAAPERARRRG